MTARNVAPCSRDQSSRGAGTEHGYQLARAHGADHRGQPRAGPRHRRGLLSSRRSGSDSGAPRGAPGTSPRADRGRCRQRRRWRPDRDIRLRCGGPEADHRCAQPHRRRVGAGRYRRQQRRAIGGRPFRADQRRSLAGRSRPQAVRRDSPDAARLAAHEAAALGPRHQPAERLRENAGCQYRAHLGQSGGWNGAIEGAGERGRSA